MGFATPQDIETTFSEFWNSTGAESNTAMFGLADIWEGPVAAGSSGVGEMSGTNTAMAIETYKDNVYILQGGGIHSWLKVITPDGTKIYDLYSMLILMTDSIWPPYFSFTVLSEHEVIAGYLYLNLKHQFMAPFGIDMAQLWRNPSFNISNSRANESTWVTGVRDNSGWSLYVNTKSSPDNCLPCSAKQSVAKTSFSCIDISFSREARLMPGYKTEQLSYSQGPGYGARIPLPIMDPAKCMRALNDYSAVFNHVKISPDALGDVGLQVSNNCSGGMYRNMIVASEYNVGAEIMSDKYIEELIEGVNNIGYLMTESIRLTGLIGEFLHEISSSLGDNDFTKSLIRDTVWWAPIWFAANQQKVNKISTESAYSLLSGVNLQDFVILLISIGNSGGGAPVSSSGSMGWIVVGKAGTTPTKMGKHNMTYFRFPFAQCISVRKIAKINGSLTIDGICAVETRANGILVWAWKYHRHNSELKAYFISNDGALTEAGSTTTGAAFSPVSGAAMAASDNGATWIIKDYFLSDFGSIDYVESEVEGGSEMQTLKQGSQISNYANVNEVTGPMGSADASYYGDGMLDSHPGRFGLDSDQVTTDLAWENHGKQFGFVAGYAGFQIKSGDRL